MDTLTFHPFDRGHIPGAHALSQAESWPHRPQDWALFLSLSEGAAAVDGERVVATALATPFGPVACANMIIVDAGRRGLGLGRRVMEAAMARVDAQEWRLIATEAGLPLYRKMGFEEYGRIVQHQGVVAADAAQAGASPEPAGPQDLAALLALDRAATGMERRPLYAALLEAGAVHVLRDAAGAIRAGAALRPFGRGEVLGPVLARDAAEAREIMAPLIASRAGRFVRVDTPERLGLGTWLVELGLARVGGGVQMRKGAAVPAPGPHEAFALAAQALG
jgi:GNAT superfamily N-acetyltransferase